MKFTKYFNYKETKKILVKVLKSKHNCLDFDYLFFALNNLYEFNKCKARFRILDNSLIFIFKNRKINDFFTIKFENKLTLKDKQKLSIFLCTILQRNL